VDDDVVVVGVVDVVLVDVVEVGVVLVVDVVLVVEVVVVGGALAMENIYAEPEAKPASSSAQAPTSAASPEIETELPKKSSAAASLAVSFVSELNSTNAAREAFPDKLEGPS